MPPFEEREGQGALFLVEPDKRVPNGPTMTGSVTIGGRRYRLAAWKKEGKQGRAAWLSMKAEKWEERGGRRDSDDSDSPF